MGPEVARSLVLILPRWLSTACFACCKDDFQRKKIVHSFAYLRSRMMDDTETRQDETMLPRRAGGCEWTMVAARVPSFTGMDRSGAVGYRWCSVYRVRCRDIRGWHWYLFGNHAVVIAVNFVTMIPVAEIDEDVCPTPE